MRPYPEPTEETLSGDTLPRLAKRYLLATRPTFLSASLLAVLTGTSWGWQLAGKLDLAAFLLAFVAVACVHAAINVLNDVFDERTKGPVARWQTTGTRAVAGLSQP